MKSIPITVAFKTPIDFFQTIEEIEKQELNGKDRYFLHDLKKRYRRHGDKMCFSHRQTKVLLRLIEKVVENRGGNSR